MKRYGCHNRAPFLEAQVLERPAVIDGQVVAVTATIPFRMRQDCSYTHTDLGKADDRCQGCSWRVNEPPPTPEIL